MWMIHMSGVPTSVFDGYLKQIPFERLNRAEAALFDLLFPLFRSPSPDDSASGRIARKQHEELAAISQGLIVTEDRSDQRLRRFAVYDFPRNRYYSVPMSEMEYVDHTLAHELRAYRNPRDVGYIDVFDLSAQEVKLGFDTPEGTTVESIEPDNAVAVLVHDLEAVPAKCRKLC